MMFAPTGLVFLALCGAVIWLLAWLADRKLKEPPKEPTPFVSRRGS
jgi:hypothetical protein